MKKLLSCIVALLLVLSLGLTGCGASPSGLTGDYRQDSLTLIDTLKTAIELPANSPDRSSTETQARRMINDFYSRYNRDSRYAKLSSFTTMRTVLNSLAGHYSSYPNRPVPQTMVDRLELELSRIESALKRGA